MNEHNESGEETLYSRRLYHLANLIMDKKWVEAHGCSRGVTLSLAEAAGSALCEEWPTPECMTVRAEMKRIRGDRKDSSLTSYDYQLLDHLHHAEVQLYDVWLASIKKRAGQLDGSFTYVQAQPTPAQAAVNVPAETSVGMVSLRQAIFEEFGPSRRLLDDLNREVHAQGEHLQQLAARLSEPQKTTVMATTSEAMVRACVALAPLVAKAPAPAAEATDEPFAKLAAGVPYAPRASGGPVPRWTGRALLMAATLGAMGGVVIANLFWLGHAWQLY